MTTVPSKTKINHRQPARIIWIVWGFFTIILGSLALYFAFLYEEGGWLPHFGQQMEFLGVVASLILWWLITQLFILIFVRKWLLRWLGGTFLCVVSFCILFRFEEMDGDMVPKFGWRWASGDRDNPIPSIASSPGTNSDSDSDSDSAAFAVHSTGYWNSFPQFQGSNRDCVISGSDKPHLSQDWSVQPPEIRWIQDTGEGFSGFVIDGQGRAYSMSQSTDNPGNELSFCLDVGTGQEIWSHPVAARFENTLGGTGPRATPALDGDRVYFLGATGELICRNASDGMALWQVNIASEFGAEIPEWGYAGSPLIYNDLVIIAPGGSDSASIVGLDKITGKTIWLSGQDPVSWSSPVILGIHGRDVLVHLNQKAVEFRIPDDGMLLASHPFGRKWPQVSIPVLWENDSVLVSAGYGVGADLIRLNPRLSKENDDQKVAGKSHEPNSLAIEKRWSTRRLRSKFAPMVPVDSERLVGLNDGVLVCLDMSNGKRLFEGDRYGHGQFLLINSPVKPILLLMDEQGTLHKIKVDENEFSPDGSLKVFGSKTWNPPALSGQYLLVRNHRQMALVSLPSGTD